MKKIVYGVLAFAPMIALAAATGDQSLSGVSTLVTSIGAIIAKIIPLMFALAIVYFFWGLIEFIRSAGDPKKAAEGKSIMIYGVIAIAVMVSIYGLVNWLAGTLGITQTSDINSLIPKAPTI